MPKLILEELLADTKLSSTQTAELLGVAAPTVKKFARQGKIKAFKIGNRYKYLWSDVQEYIQANDAKIG
jgi:excisionase family DNA binding protein